MKVLTVAFLLTIGSITIIHAEDPRSASPPADHYDAAHRFVFYSVLEGCYEDGLTAEDIDIIIPKREKGGGREMTVNFVYACPLCHPAFEALKIYSSRQPFYGQKTTSYDTFGQGLDNAVAAQLRKEPADRRAAVQKLITRWIGKRMDLLRLDEKERKELLVAIREKKERGEEMLKSFQERGEGDYYGEKYRDWKNCPICSGATNFVMGGE